MRRVQQKGSVTTVLATDSRPEKRARSVPNVDRESLDQKPKIITHRAELAPGTGQPTMLDIGLIDEDPLQPRSKDNPGFSTIRLNELAASIRLRGIKTPISVRDNPAASGRFLINHGARRFRASARAGNMTIPAFIDNDYNEADQVVENLQRNELTAREIADYIGRELAKGIKKRAIAVAISKSPAFVTQHATLLDLPDPIAVAFNAGRVKDVTLVNELVAVFRRQPQAIGDWLANDDQEVTRGSVKLLRAFLEDRECRDEEGDAYRAWSGDATSEQEDVVVEMTLRSPSHAKPIKKMAVHVQHCKRMAVLLIDRHPSVDGRAWLRFEEDGVVREVDLAGVRVVALRNV